MVSEAAVAWAFLGYLFLPVIAYFAWVLYRYIRRRLQGKPGEGENDQGDATE